MDPLANLVEQRQLARSIIQHEFDPERVDEHDVRRLAELVLALDGWRVKGGFDPYAEMEEAQARTQLEHAVRTVQEALDRAMLRDSWRMRATLLALSCALLAPSVLESSVDEEHKVKLRAILDDAAKLALPLSGKPIDDIHATISEYVNRLAAEDATPFAFNLADYVKRS